MRKSVKVALLACLMLLVSTLMFTACNITRFLPSFEETTSSESVSEITTPEETTPVPHAHVEVIDPAVAPTCARTGRTEGKHCSVCGEVLVAQKVISVLGHTETLDPAVAPTCAEEGKTEGKHCSVCNKILVAQQTIPALGHKYVSTVTPPATSGDVVAKYTCSVCGDSYTQTIQLVDFTVTEDNRGVIGYTGKTGENLVIPAVFQNNGVWYRVTAIGDRAFDGCENLTSVTIPNTVKGIGKWAFHWCTNLTRITLPNSIKSMALSSLRSCDSLKTITFDGTKNEWDSITKDDSWDLFSRGYVIYCTDGNICKKCVEVITPAVAATCAATGLTEGKHCSVCGKVIVAQNIIPARGHIETNIAAISATCTSEGRTQGKQCLICKEILVAQTVVAKLAHTTGAVIVENNIAPDCVNNGSYQNVVYCTICNTELKRETVIVDALGHTEAIDKEVTPTCTSTGLTEGKHCSVCNEVIVAQTIISALPHTEVIDAAVPPTFTEVGITEGKHCSVCETVIVAQKLTLSGSRYGYYDFANRTNGAAMQELYYDLYCICEQFMLSTQNVEAVDGLYVIGTINANDYFLTIDEVVAVWKVFYAENPKYYWLSNTITFTGPALPLCIDEVYANADYRTLCDAAIEEMVDACYEIITVDLSALEKALAIHDFILGYMEYAYESDGVTPEDDIWAHNMVGCAKYNLGVCEAYAKTYLYLCLLNNVECIIVSGDAGEEHAWNMICLDGAWYAVDCTWDDTNTSGLTYDYFGMSETYLESTHTAESPDGVGIEYWFALPELSERSLELVYLYEGDTLLGTFGNIDMAFEEMTNTAGDYTIKLYEYTYVDWHNIYSVQSPHVKCLSVVGRYIDLGNGYFHSTYIWLNTNIIVNSNIVIENIRLWQRQCYVYGLYIQNFLLTTQGYYCSSTVPIIGDERSELVIQTYYETEIFAPINIYKLTETNGSHGVLLRNNSQIDIVSVSSVSIHRDPYTLSSPQIVIGHLSCSSFTVLNFAEISIGKISNQIIENHSVYIHLRFERIEEYAKLNIGEILCSIDLTLDGFITTETTDPYGNVVNSWTSNASPFNIKGSIVVLGKLSDFEKIRILHQTNTEQYGLSSVIYTHCYQITENGEIICKDYTEQNGLIIMDNSIVSYTGTDTVIVIPDGITSIADYAFAYCTELISITIPNRVTSIGDYAFDGCCNLTSITMPSDLESIGEAVFLGCSSLTSIIIPDNVKNIGVSAFSDCSNLISITIGKGVTIIGDDAFRNCSSLTSITIPDNVTSIGDRSFYTCTSLTSITFEGTVAKWNTIGKGYDWNWGVPATEVICSDGVVSLN